VLELSAFPQLVDPVLIAAFEGWNDAADAASSAIDHLIASWQAVPIAALDPEDYYDFQVNRPTISLSADNERELTWPTTQLCTAHLPGSERDVVLLRGIEPNMRWRAFCAELLDTAAQPAAGRPTWTTAWTLSWNPVPGAVRYEITAVGPEGEGSAPMRRTTEPTLTLSVASGAGQLPTSAAVRDAQIAYRSTQLGVRVTAVAADGVVGLPSRVLPVGQPPAG